MTQQACRSLWRAQGCALVGLALITASAAPVAAQDPPAAPPPRQPAPAQPGPAEQAPEADQADASAAADPAALPAATPAPSAAAAPPSAAAGERDEPGEAEAEAPGPQTVQPPGPAAPASAARYSQVLMPLELEYVDGAAVPDGYVKDTRMRRGLVIGGAVTLGAAWALSSLAATIMIDAEAHDDDDFGPNRNRRDGAGFPDPAVLYIPVAGPFIALGTMNAEGGGRAALAADGMVQLAGLGMFIAGLAAQRTVLVRSPHSREQSSVWLAPSAPGAPGGASLIGAF